ncbi:molybdopterin-containing oxidoreductase family protein [Gordonia rhizosphera]|uniref:Putative oxidoreductase n=1 Tax=Gordonia rhizosphera NBRC 16068 TaxID=1108045 RepID=K6WNZ6_9ACTN|nr:molybdopterin-dependent oxidoreductase [Gordonia rhizosphera]GAB93827.1 putative oxidoreductase [Gordonia rhizosphera NBRC 16068]
MREEKVTYCRICEPLCGMIATVEDDRLIELRPDKQHPLSKGFACPKGIAFAEIVNDPDRVLHPLRKTADGGFEQISWETALTEIRAKLRAVYDRHGKSGIGWYFGNPATFSTGHTMWTATFTTLLGTPHVYSAGSQDVNNRFAASHFLYGNPVAAPIPDINRVDYLVIMGANPIVSHGSVMSSPRIRDGLKAIEARGGRVVVVDPRRTETAREFEWLPIVPDTDTLLLLALLHVMFDEGLADEHRITKQASGIETLKRVVARFAPEDVADRTDVPAETIRDMARTLVTTERAAIYGRIGTSLGRTGTLTTALLDIVNLVAGNLDTVGGSMFGDLGVPGERLGISALQRFPGFTWAGRRSRVGDLPQVLGTAPASVMAKEMTTPGTGQLRALFVSAGNPVLSVPNGAELSSALDGLDLMVSLDIYRNETNAHADYILPATTMYERGDFLLPFQMLFTTPFRQATDPVISPRGEAREEWTVVTELMGAIGRRSPLIGALHALDVASAKLGARWTPERLSDLVVRISQGGNRFGLRRGGLTYRRLVEENPHGVIVADHLTPGRLRKLITHRDRRVCLDAPEILAELDRLEPVEDPRLPLRLIGLREIRSENSWQHNAPLLLRGGRRHAARMHPDDARQRGIGEGDLVTVRSAYGQIELPVTITDEMKAGVVAIPHGWGHNGSGGWTRANAAAATDLGSGGANVNALISSDPEDLERLAGMANMTGVPIEVSLLDTGADTGDRSESAASGVG